jgi:hypothetical protein
MKNPMRIPMMLLFAFAVALSINQFSYSQEPPVPDSSSYETVDSMVANSDTVAFEYKAPLLDEEAMAALMDAFEDERPFYKLWYFWVGIIILLWEIIGRAVPSVVNWSFTGTLSGLLDMLIKNRDTRGGAFKSRPER